MENQKLKICQRCGKEFAPNGNSQKYCLECGIIVKKEKQKLYKKYYNDIHGIKTFALKYCIECGKEFKPTSANQRYCEECNHKQISKQWIKNNPEKWRKIYIKAHNKRRNLDFIPLNEYFKGAEAHHIDEKYVVYIPKELHRSIYHNHNIGQGMDEINIIA